MAFQILALSLTRLLRCAVLIDPSNRFLRICLPPVSCQAGAGHIGEGSKDLVQGLVGGTASSASKMTDALDGFVREAGGMDADAPSGMEVQKVRWHARTGTGTSVRLPSSECRVIDSSRVGPAHSSLHGCDAFFVPQDKTPLCRSRMEGPLFLRGGEEKLCPLSNPSMRTYLPHTRPSACSRQTSNNTTIPGS